MAVDQQESDQLPRFWDHKPFWCQPWTIVLSGIGAVAGSWGLLARWWITAPLALLVLAWWWLFLILVPGAYQQQAEAETEARQGEDERSKLPG